MPSMDKPFEGTLLAAICFREWPSKTNSVLLKQVLEGGTITVIAGSNGELAVHAASSSGETHSEQFQRVQIDAGARAVLCVIWNGEKISLRLNNHDLGIDRTLSLNPIVISSNPEHLAPIETLCYPDLRPEHASREVEVFFLETVMDIDAKVVERTRYGLIRAAGLLRQLLLDGLIHEVNRPYRLKLTFEVIEFDSTPRGQPVTHWQTLNPSAFPGVKVVTVGLAALLAIPVLRVGKSTASVRDVIKACANAKGGVHYGPPGNSQEDLVLAWDKRFQASTVEISLDFLAGLCKVCLAGVQPIVNAIAPKG